MRRPGDANVGRQPVVAGDLGRDVGIGDVGERPRAARHAQVLEAILGEHRQRRGTAVREPGLDPGDPAAEDRLVGHGQRQLLAEVEQLTVEVQERRLLATVGSPVADLQLAVIQAVHVFSHPRPELAAGQGGRLLTVDGDRRAR